MEVFEKSQTVDPEVRAHIYSLVSAIGGSSTVHEGQYVLGDDALACLKDLSRWIRLYDDRTNRHDVKRCMAEANLVRGDLLPILAQQGDNHNRSILATKVALNCLDLLNTLTWPIERKEETMTVNTHRHLPYIQLAQVNYKRAVLHHDTAQILRTAISVAVPAIAQSKSERSPRDDSIIGVVLYFLRNIAIINQPADLPSQGDDNDVSRLTTIEAFHQQNVLQLLLTIASSINDEYPMHDIVLLEILFQLLKGIDAKELFKNEQQLQDDRQDAFKALLDKEKAMNASYARNAPSRHHRFGTMIWVKRPDEKVSTLSGQNVIFDEQKTMHQMDQSKSWNKPKPRRKKTEFQNETNDFDTTVHLDEPTRKVLRGFVEDFLDSSFNPLFNSLRRALTSEAERAQKYNTRQYYYMMGWFLQAERARQELFKKQGKVPSASEDSPFAYIAAVMTQENFILLGRKIQQSLDDKEWSDLHACMRAFTQILLTVSAMADSSSEDDQEIAENIQNRIFYEETTHDQVIAVLRGYNEQGFAFLDACTDMAHTFLRMLERYSKQNVDMQVRSKRRARRKRNAEARANGAQDVDTGAASEAEDEVEAHRASSERRFDFTRFASKFVTEGCVNTFVRFTSYYADLSVDQLKRAHRFFYRCAFKMERAIFLFRVDVLHLFNRMIKGPDGLSKESPMFKEWEELVKQFFKRCLKKLDERRELMVEMLFNKMPATIFYLENGFDAEITKSRPRPPAELMVKPGMSREEEISVAVSVLVNQGKLDALAWTKDCLASGAEERKAWEDEQSARASIENLNVNTLNSENAENHDDAENAPDQTETAQQDSPKAPSIILKPDSTERKTSLFKDKFLRLLLKLLSLERLGKNDDPDASWIVPSSLSSTTLYEDLALIKRFEFDLPTFDGVAPESLLRNKSAAGLHARADRNAAAAAEAASALNSSDEEEGASLSDLDAEAEALFEPGGPTASKPLYEKPAKKRSLHRRRHSVTEEERKRRAEEKKKRDREKDQKIKSALRVTDSDDEIDEEADAEFFRLEEERRKKISGAIRNALLKEVDDGEGVKGKRKAAAGSKKAGKRRKTVEVEEESDDEGMMDAGSDADADAEEAPEDTPMETSPQKDVPSGNEEEEEEKEEEMVKTRPTRGKAPRLPFLDDSDSE